MQGALGWLSGESKVDARIVVSARAVVDDGVVEALHIAVHEGADRRRGQGFRLLTLVLLHLLFSFVTAAATAVLLAIALGCRTCLVMKQMMGRRMFRGTCELHHCTFILASDGDDLHARHLPGVQVFLGVGTSVPFCISIFGNTSNAGLRNLIGMNATIEGWESVARGREWNGFLN